MIDLAAYLARIGLDGPLQPMLADLQRIVRAHAQAIPFENLDVLLGRHISVELPDVARKLVDDRRGGYCFEQNGLLLAALAAVGFEVQPLSARVRYQRPRDYLPPRTHLFVRIDLDGVAWLADVGVGSTSMTGAIRLDLDGEQATPHEPRRLLREGGVVLNQIRYGETWHDVYEFTGEQMPPIDRAVANWWTSASPQSSFRERLTVALALPDGGRLSLHNRTRTRRWADGAVSTTEVATPAELLRVLREDFGLMLPDDAVLTCPGLVWEREHRAPAY